MCSVSRDCANCIHRIPQLNEEDGIWEGAECESWNCKFVDRKEALESLKQIKLIKKIIESAPNLPEDIRYQMIVGILYGVNGPNNETSNN